MPENTVEDAVDPEFLHNLARLVNRVKRLATEVEKLREDASGDGLVDGRLLMGAIDNKTSREKGPQGVHETWQVEVERLNEASKSLLGY